MTTEAHAVELLKNYFAGCKCIGVWDGLNKGREPSPYGQVQFYDVGSDNVIGAWYKDGARQLWPKSWLSGKHIRRAPGRTFADLRSGKTFRRPLGRPRKKLKRVRVPLQQSAEQTKAKLPVKKATKKRRRVLIK